MRWIRYAAAVPAVALLAALTAAGPAAAAPAAPLTVASVTYSVTGNCIGDGGCTTHITISSNPSNGGVRAWEECTGNGSPFFLFGSWHFNAGETSNTASCSAVRSGTFTSFAGFDYPKSPFTQYQCYSFTAGDPKSGAC